MLNAFDASNEILHCEDLFGRGTPDEKWLQELAQMGDDVAAVSRDRNILSNAVERMALADGGLPFVNLKSGWGNLDFNTLAWKLVRAWPAVSEAVTTAKVSRIYEVTVNGAVVPLGPVK